MIRRSAVWRNVGWTASPSTRSNHACIVVTYLDARRSLPASLCTMPPRVEPKGSGGACCCPLNAWTAGPSTLRLFVRSRRDHKQPHKKRRRPINDCDAAQAPPYSLAGATDDAFVQQRFRAAHAPGRTPGKQAIRSSSGDFARSTPLVHEPACHTQQHRAGQRLLAHAPLAHEVEGGQGVGRDHRDAGARRFQ